MQAAVGEMMDDTETIETHAVNIHWYGQAGEFRYTYTIHRRIGATVRTSGTLNTRDGEDARDAWIRLNPSIDSPILWSYGDGHWRGEWLVRKGGDDAARSDHVD
jgi:hypothetical protein